MNFSVGEKNDEFWTTQEEYYHKTEDLCLNLLSNIRRVQIDLGIICIYIILKVKRVTDISQRKRVDGE